MRSPACTLTRTRTPTAATKSLARPPPHSHGLLAAPPPPPAWTRWSSTPPPRLLLLVRRSPRRLWPTRKQRSACSPGPLQRQMGGMVVQREAEAVCRGATPSLHPDAPKQVRGESHLSNNCVTTVSSTCGSDIRLPNTASPAMFLNWIAVISILRSCTSILPSADQKCLPFGFQLRIQCPASCDKSRK